MRVQHKRPDAGCAEHSGTKARNTNQARSPGSSRKKRGRMSHSFTSAIIRERLRAACEDAVETWRPHKLTAPLPLLPIQSVERFISLMDERQRFFVLPQFKELEQKFEQPVYGLLVLMRIHMCHVLQTATR